MTKQHTELVDDEQIERELAELHAAQWARIWATVPTPAEPRP